jgi:hypothetical protein
VIGYGVANCINECTFRSPLWSIAEDPQASVGNYHLLYRT